MEEYVKEMEITMLRADIEEDTEAIMARFLSGLRPEIAEVVELKHYVELTDMVDKATKVGWRLKRRGTTRPSNIPSSSNWRTYLPKREEKPMMGTSGGPSKVEAKPESFKKGFKPNNDTSKARNCDTKCFKCQGFGHITSQCPNRRTMIMLDSGEVVTDDESNYEDMPPLVEEEADSGEEYPTNEQLGLVV